MNVKRANITKWLRFAALCFLPTILFGVACSDNSKAAPTKTEVTREPGLYEVENPDVFPITTVMTRNLPTVLTASGTVTPDVNRTIHVTSQGSGRVVALRVRLGDYVQKGKILLSIYSAELAGAFSDYQKAVADERLANRALERAKLLYSHGALAQKDLEQLDDAEEKAKADLRNTEQHVRILGGDIGHPSTLIQLRAPVSGTIVEQNISGFEGIKSLDNSPSLFTIADLSNVWVLCDVYENDLGEVHLGDPAEIRLNAYAGKTYRGKVADISRVLDPNLRSAKVRIVLPNPTGNLRPGMYASATFRSRKLEPRLVVPGTAIMRLQDKDWLFRKDGGKRFRQIEVHTLGATPDGFQQVQGDVKGGDTVAINALDFSSAVAEQK
ncbi:MAG: efflux RND transporter periplasmic adaptor subunit [Acidobacteriota bacterium]|nr:efflux RND transporter periplasmic adaptor subunit [Acidobacteriota bacterium]